MLSMSFGKWKLITSKDLQIRASKELFVYYVLLNLKPQVFKQKRRDFAPLSYNRLLDLTLKCHGHILTNIAS